MHICIVYRYPFVQSKLLKVLFILSQSDLCVTLLHKPSSTVCQLIQSMGYPHNTCSPLTQVRETKQ